MQARYEGPEPLSVMIISQPVDAIWTEVRVYQGEVQAVYRTTLPMGHLDYFFDFTAGARDVSFFHICQDVSRDESLLSKEKLLPFVPLPTRWVWVSKGLVPAELKQAVEDLHCAYDANQAMLTAAYFERETQRIAEEKALATNPPKSKDSVIQYFPIRSSSR
jgi:hypothetical protein